MFKEEIDTILNVYKIRISFLHLSKMLHDLLKAIQLKKYIYSNLYLFFKSSDTIFYSYWQDSSTLSLILLKKIEPTIKIISRAHGSDVYFNAQKSNYLSFRKYISQNIDKLFFVSERAMNYQENLVANNYKSFCVSKLGTRAVSKKQSLIKEKYMFSLAVQIW